MMIELNQQQQMAVEYGHDQIQAQSLPGPLLIIAGAGTGKTNTLAHKTAHLILNGVSQQKILLMTFSRRAAHEMAQRAETIVTQELQKKKGIKQRVKLPWKGTFHSIGCRLLRMYAEQVGLENNFAVMDRNDAADMLDVLRHELKLANSKKRFPKKMTCLEVYSRCINTQDELENVLVDHFPWCLEWQNELKQLFKEYTLKKVEQACLDYDDLLLYWLYLSEIPSLAKKVRDMFDHVLIDEYQDTNLLQHRLLMNLFPDGKGLTVVGDDAQSIYSFRAAEVDNILNFPNEFTPPAQVVRLNQNYRSTQNLLDASNALMEDSQQGYKNALVSAKKKGDKAKLVSVEDDAVQANYIIENILENREQGTSLKQQAVLFRAASHSDRLEVELTRRNIPFVKYGGLKFLEAAHVKDALGILRWGDNLKHQMSCYRTMKLIPGVGAKTAEQVYQLLQQHQFNDEGLAVIKEKFFKNDYIPALMTMLGDIKNDVIAWPAALDKVIEFYTPLLEENYQDHFVRQGDLEQLLQISRQYQDRQRFLTELTLDPPVSSSDLAGPPTKEEDFLILSTLHSAKGQEWHSVYLMNVADGNYPNEYACGSDKAIEEERRLLYVGMTRAKTQLHLIQPFKYWVPEQMKHGDKHVLGGKSRFLTSKVMPHLQQSLYPEPEHIRVDPKVAQQQLADIRSKILGRWN